MSEPVPPTPPDHNRRLDRRRPAKGRLRVVVRRGSLDLGPNLALAVLDLSETGSRLVVKEPLRAGSEVSVSMEGQANVRPVLRVGTVAWSMPTADGAYCAGVRFQKRLPYRDFLEFSREPLAGEVRTPGSAPPSAVGKETSDLNPAPTPNASPVCPERRHSERKPGQRLFRCRLSLPEGGPDLPAMVFDVSADGVGMMASRRLEPGAAIVLRIAEAGAGLPALDLPARTVYGDEMRPGLFAVGADFPRPLSAEELEAILFRMGGAVTSGE